MQLGKEAKIELSAQILKFFETKELTIDQAFTILDHARTMLTSIQKVVYYDNRTNIVTVHAHNNNASRGNG